MALAAAVAIVAIVGVFFTAQLPRAEALSTRQGEQRAIELSDASVVHLNTDSKIEVRLDDAERNIHLLHGEALFKVAQDSHRPFRVHARAATIQAIGTQFNVYDRPEGTRVSVLEGRVRVTPQRPGASSSSAQPPQILQAGEEVEIGLDGIIRRNNTADISRTVAWRQRRLVFDNTSLEDMVREFNRYNRSVQIRLDNVPPGLHHYDGIFDADDPGSLATLLSREKDLSVETRDQEIVIRHRP